MYWNKNKKKYIVIIFGGILILVILCLGDYGIRYYNAPIEKDYKYIGTGMLVHLSDFTNGELVSVEMRRKTAYYIWGNQEDYIQGNVWLNGEKIFGKDDMEIVGLFINAEPYYSCITSTEKNNLHDMDTWMFFKWFFKAAVAIYLVTHTFDIVMAVFDIGQNVVSGAAGVIHGNTSIDIDSTIAQMRTGMENMGVGELLGLSIETLLISLCLKIMAILITVILYGRMIEIYCTVSIAPIPIATMSNREWGSIGTNYLKGLFALAFQGFLIMVCVGIYAVLINGMIIADNIHSALFSVAAYTVILCFSLFKTGSLAKSIFHAH